MTTVLLSWRLMTLMVLIKISKTGCSLRPCPRQSQRTKLPLPQQSALQVRSIQMHSSPLSQKAALDQNLKVTMKANLKDTMKVILKVKLRVKAKLKVKVKVSLKVRAKVKARSLMSQKLRVVLTQRLMLILTLM